MDISRSANVYEECENPLMKNTRQRFSSNIEVMHMMWALIFLTQCSPSKMELDWFIPENTPSCILITVIQAFKALNHISKWLTSKYCNLRTRPVILITLKRNRNAKHLWEHLLLLQLLKHGEQEFPFSHLLVQKVMRLWPDRNLLRFLGVGNMKRQKWTLPSEVRSFWNTKITTHKA